MFGTLPAQTTKYINIGICRIYKFHILDKGMDEFDRIYQLTGEQCEGGFGVVYKAIRLVDNFPVAVKCIQTKHIRSWDEVHICFEILFF